MPSVAPLFAFAYVPQFELKLADLKDMAQHESWEYSERTPSSHPLPILHSYLHHTFMRVQEEN